MDKLGKLLKLISEIKDMPNYLNSYAGQYETVREQITEIKKLAREMKKGLDKVD